eukprot:m.5085 g.5085  ORF g.5085 m.5085 type:complete len:120 (-) comp7397_c0_seq1:307-666(-)
MATVEPAVDPNDVSDDDTDTFEASEQPIKRHHGAIDDAQYAAITGKVKKLQIAECRQIAYPEKLCIVYVQASLRNQAWKASQKAGRPRSHDYAAETAALVGRTAKLVPRPGESSTTRVA